MVALASNGPLLWLGACLGSRTGVNRLAATSVTAGCRTRRTIVTGAAHLPSFVQCAGLLTHRLGGTRAVLAAAPRLAVSDQLAAAPHWPPYQSLARVNTRRGEGTPPLDAAPIIFRAVAPDASGVLVASAPKRSLLGRIAFRLAYTRRGATAVHRARYTVVVAATTGADS